MKKYIVLLIFFLIAHNLTIAKNYFKISNNRSYLYLNGDADYHINENELIFMDSNIMNILNNNIYNIQLKNNEIHFYHLLRSNKINNSLLKFVRKGEYKSYIFNLNNKSLSFLGNFYTNQKYNSSAWEGNNYYFNYFDNNNDIEIYSSSNSELIAGNKKEHDFSMISYDLNYESYNFKLRRDRLENERNTVEFYEISAGKGNYLIGYKTDTKSSQKEIFFNFKNHKGNLKYFIEPFYREKKLYDFRTKVIYKNLYIKKHSKYSWFSYRKSNYYETGYNYEDILKFYARYIENQKLDFINIDNKILSGINLDYLFKINDYIKLVFDYNYINNENYSSEYNTYLYLLKNFFKNDLHLKFYLNYVYIDESNYLKQHSYWNCFLQAQILKAKIYLKWKNILNDEYYGYLNKKKTETELEFGISAYFYN